MHLETGPEDRELAFLDTNVTFYRSRVGDGHVVVVLGTEQFARQSLGHAFGVPDPGQRATYDAIYHLLDHHSGVQVGDRPTYAIVE